MSYCRFSSDNWKSDVYVYEHCHGFWSIHVAGNRHIGEPPEELAFDDPNWLERHREISAWLNKAEREPIGLPHDGETFEEATIEECIDRLLGLRALGYHVPEYALERLRDENAEETGA